MPSSLPGENGQKKSLSDRLGKMESAIMGIHPSGNLTREMMIVQQKPQRACSIPVALEADILLEGTAAVTAPVAMGTRTTPGQTPNKTSILSQHSTQR